LAIVPLHIQSLLITQLLRILAEDGFSSEQLLAISRFHLNDSKDVNPIETLKLLELASSLSDDTTLMIRLGQRMDVSSYGTFSFALMSSADLQGALKLLLRYGAIIGIPIFNVIEINNFTALRIRLDVGSPIQKRLITELAFAQILANANSLVDESIFSGVVHFNYSEIPQQESFGSLLHVPVKFNQAHSEILIPKSILKCPISTANPVANVIFQNQCDSLLRALNQVENFSSAIRRILVETGGEVPMIKEVADKLCVSESTLRRRLSYEKTNFRTICDEVRNALARQYLSNTKLTVSEVASLIGYSETVSFRRAFIRWNKTTPSEFRQKSSVE
jgi:AraC-like DNA-binding protein